VSDHGNQTISFTTSAGTNFQFPGDFTIEGWVYPSNNSGDASFFIVSSDGGNYFGLNLSISANVFNIYLNTGAPVSIVSDISTNTWTHVALIRNGTGTNNIKAYVNGTLKGSLTNTSTLGYSNPTICRIGGGVAGVNRSYSNFRVCKSALYTTAFTPSTQPLTTSSQGATNCVLLTAKSNGFLNEATSLSASITGTPSVQAFSPFAPTVAYSPALHGGSAYFDGYADYLRPPPNQPALLLGTEDFTIECWLYFSSGQPQINPVLFSSSGSSNTSGLFLMQFNNQPSGQLGVFSSVNLNNASTNNYLPFNAWTHVAVSRSSVSTYRYFLNGKAVNNIGTSSASITTNDWQIGYWFLDSGHPLKGYLSDFRIIKGTALYTSDFAPPTAPLTAIANTSLLLNFTNAAITDATAKNVLETVGDARISTAQSKWTGGSMSFDGSGDGLYIAGNQELWILGSSGNFTIEGWFYLDYTVANSTQVLLISNYNSWHSGFVGQWTLGLNSAGYISWINSIGNTWLSDTQTRFKQWVHVAAVRNGSTITLYVNGTSIGTQTSNQDYTSTTSNGLKIGGSIAGIGQLVGYANDIRITKGYARYTANFTPPTGSFRLR
jgi:hypothetical protein